MTSQKLYFHLFSYLPGGTRVPGYRVPGYKMTSQNLYFHMFSYLPVPGGTRVHGVPGYRAPGYKMTSQKLFPFVFLLTRGSPGTRVPGTRIPPNTQCTCVFGYPGTRVPGMVEIPIRVAIRTPGTPKKTRVGLEFVPGKNLNWISYPGRI